MTVLIVEDDTTIATAIAGFLKDQGFDTLWVNTIKRAKQSLNQNIDIILVDYSLPDGVGYELCRYSYSHFKIPLIFITVNDNEKDIIKCLEAGADDYITKPFKLSILLSRINAVLRRSPNSDSVLLKCQDVVLDKSSGQVYNKGEEVLLTATEFKLLLTFMENIDQLLTREILLKKLWDQSGNFVNDNTLTVTMKRLREKLGFPSSIKTIRGIGYRLQGSLQ